MNTGMSLLDKNVIFSLPANCLFFGPFSCMRWSYFLSEKYLLLKKKKSSYKKKIKLAFHIFFGMELCDICQDSDAFSGAASTKAGNTETYFVSVVLYAKYIEI